MKKRKDMSDKERRQVIIWQNQIWFKSVIAFPRTSTIIWILVFLYKEVRIFLGQNSTVPMILCGFAGCFWCIFNYLILKILLSYPILKICYLQKLSEKEDLEDEE